MARGKVPVERFKEAAEKHGYIVVGSNTSRNGPWETSFQAAQAMWQDTRARFSVAPERAYATGFSGGARVACAVGRMFRGNVAGVIGIGAGFPLGIGQEPTKDLPFIYFGAVGIRDFNYPELIQLEKILTDLKVVHRIEVFQAGHDWPPPDVCEEALEWMELHAMKSGKRQRDGRLIEEWFHQRVEKARAFRAMANLAESYRRFRWLTEDFDGLRDVAAVRDELAQLEGSKDVKKAIKREEQRAARIAAMVEASYGELRQALGPFQDGSGDPWQLREALSQLRFSYRLKLAEEKKEKEEGIAAERFVRGVLVHAYEQAVEAMTKKDYPKARLNWSIALECAPASAHILYMLARTHALMNSKPEALETLRRAVEKGYTDLESIEKNEDFAPLRGMRAYEELVEKLRKR
jgi:tetratricopeptide (TPR) repeat protein